MNLKILSYSFDGTVKVLIDGKEYIYFIDAGYIALFLTKQKNSDGAALQFLKEKARSCINLSKTKEPIEIESTEPTEAES